MMRRAEGGSWYDRAVKVGLISQASHQPSRGEPRKHQEYPGLQRSESVEVKTPCMGRKENERSRERTKGAPFGHPAAALPPPSRPGRRLDPVHLHSRRAHPLPRAVRRHRKRPLLHAPQVGRPERLRALIGSSPQTEWSLHDSDQVLRMAVFVSKDPWCLYDILARSHSGEWTVEVPVIVSNHADLEPVARRFGVEFRSFSITKENKSEVEDEQLALLQSHRIDVVVLARYMQILTGRF